MAHGAFEFGQYLRQFDQRARRQGIEYLAAGRVDRDLTPQAVGAADFRLPQAVIEFEMDGTVRKKHDAELAYQLAREVPGVIHVRERLRIGRDRDDRVRRATVGMGYEEGRPRRRREWRS